ncbi:MAG: hypothetical protein JW795_06245, partial [Chitinivibrionales bacterium]|nr:hypothetical protein [Chitinivibrionales bacterium]
MKIQTTIVLIFLFRSTAIIIAQEDDFYTVDNIVKFATYLYNENEYDRGIGEYLRAVSLCEDRRFKDSLLMRIAVGYMHIGKPRRVRNYCAIIASNSSDPILADRAGCLAAFSYYTERRYDSLMSFTRTIEPGISDPLIRCRLAAITIASLLKQYRWEEAVLQAQSVKKKLPSGICDSVIQTLLICGEKGSAIRLKSPALAAVLSSLLPGSGKVYANRGWDGLFSFLIFSTNVWQSYAGFSKDGLASTRGIA